MSNKSIYHKIIERIFFSHYTDGIEEFTFNRSEIGEAADALNIKRPKNLGDVIYSFRYRDTLPQNILETQTDGLTWVIEGAGHGKYAFKLCKVNRITPNESLITIKIPDSTPEIISAYALTDEQALLAKVRYNRLIDTFLGITAYSLQNHLRTTVKGIGQIEIDEIYVGVDRFGRQYVVPVQAKGGSDQLASVQASQDFLFCQEKYSELICRPVAAQFMEDNLIAMFELGWEDATIKLVDEKHYRLVLHHAIEPQDLRNYQQRPL